MKIDFFKQKYFDLILIRNKSVGYFQISKEKSGIKILKSFKVEAEIYKDGALKLANLDPALNLLIEKFKIKEFGIILDLPNIIFQKISLPKVSRIKDPIFNYLKTNLPLPIENYAFYYKEEGFKPIGSIGIFSILLTEKSLIEKISQMVGKYNLAPLFITLGSEIIFQYLINKSYIEFNEEYLVFFLSENNVLTLLIKNFTIEKLIIEDYNPNKINLSFTILKIYNFLKRELSSTAKIFFFIGKEKINLPEINQPAAFFEIPPENIIIEGSFLAFNYVLENKDIIDFLPFKNYYAYFLNRLPNIIIFLSIYLILLTFLTSGLFLGFYPKLNQEKAKLESSVKEINISDLNEEILNSLIKAKELLNTEKFLKISQINDIIKITGFESINYQNDNLILSLKTDKDNLTKVKYQISQQFPQAKIIEEISLENEVVLKYSF